MATSPPRYSMFPRCKHQSVRTRGDVNVLVRTTVSPTFSAPPRSSPPSHSQQLEESSFRSELLELHRRVEGHPISPAPGKQERMSERAGRKASKGTSGGFRVWTAEETRWLLADCLSSRPWPATPSIAGPAWLDTRCGLTASAPQGESGGGNTIQWSDI
eukprot:366157-Hanusia_phi.AAC.1